MTIPSRPAPPPPSSNNNSLSAAQQSQNGGVVRNNITIKLPPPPGAKKFPINLTSNNYSSAPTITSSTSSSSTKSITRHFPAAKTRYAPATNWDGSPFDSINSAHQDQNNSSLDINSIFPGNKRAPPPRPPPPKIQTSINSNGVLKKPGPPQSVNVLSNLFGRRLKTSNSSIKKQIPAQSLSKSSNDNITYQTTSSVSKHVNYASSNFFENTFTSSTNSTVTGVGNNDVQLISFDSPPSSPTFTQKSNSDCVSVDSFSSDSNFSSPQNGSVSQPESGFEDDFTAITRPPDPWETLNDPYNDCSSSSSGFGGNSNYMVINDLKMTTAHPVRNLNTINKTQTENHLCNGKSLIPPNPTLSMPTIIRPKTQKGVAPKPPIILPKPNLIQQQLYNHQLINNNLCEEDLPMPNCPPPPPPCGISDYDDQYEDGPAYGITLYAFDGAEIGDLSFRENEKIYIISQLNDEWFMGRTKSGCEGMFPSNHIQIKVPLKGNIKVKNGTENIEHLSNTNVLHSTHKIKVLYNFDAEQSNDLTICENDIVTVLSKINEDWLFGEIDNRQGQFPAAFIEYVPPDLPLKMP